MTTILHSCRHQLQSFSHGLEQWGWSQFHRCNFDRRLFGQYLSYGFGRSLFLTYSSLLWNPRLFLHAQVRNKQLCWRSPPKDCLAPHPYSWQVQLQQSVRLHHQLWDDDTRLCTIDNHQTLSSVIINNVVQQLIPKMKNQKKIDR